MKKVAVSILFYEKILQLVVKLRANLVVDLLIFSVFSVKLNMTLLSFKYYNFKNNYIIL